MLGLLFDNFHKAISQATTKPIHVHHRYVKENLDNDGVHIVGCSGCPHLWVHNTRLPYGFLLEMDWEYADIFVKFHTTSEFAKEYANKIPAKWFAHQNKCYPEFNN
jgi:hypothetical protein